MATCQNQEPSQPRTERAPISRAVKRAKPRVRGRPDRAREGGSGAPSRPPNQLTTSPARRPRLAKATARTRPRGVGTGARAQEARPPPPLALTHATPRRRGGRARGDHGHPIGSPSVRHRLARSRRDPRTCLPLNSAEQGQPARAARIRWRGEWLNGYCCLMSPHRHRDRCT